MANPIQFGMINDQSGEQVQGTLATEGELRLRGFRVVDVGRYDAAIGQQRDAYMQPVPPDPVAEALAKQNYDDAARVARGEGLEDGTADRPVVTSPKNNTELRARYEKGSVDQLKQFAGQQGIDLTGATRKGEIVDKLMEATAFDEGGGDGDNDDDSGSGGGAGGAE